ncbi:hypothetical protein [Streptomyces sp. AC512_CC834]|nr:hypothetical protein [Streptomyces sp. AC512_CC834]
MVIEFLLRHHVRLDGPVKARPPALHLEKRDAYQPGAPEFI